MAAEPKEIEQRELTAVGDLIELVKPVQDETVAPIFRGHADAAWPLVPDLFRCASLPVLWPTWNLFEHKLLSDFWRRAVALQPRPDDLLHERAVARHYGLPTRLLDWSTNPLVALHFAVQAPDDACGILWELRTSATVGGSLPHADQISAQGHTVKYFPPHLSPRIIAQHACFTVHPLPNDQVPFQPLEEAFAAGSSGLRLRRFVIDARAKRDMRHTLAALGIGPAALFPDLSGFAEDVKASVQRALELQSG